MAKYVIEDTTLTGIAGAIREKNGTTNTYKPTEMAAAIAAIVSGGSGGGFNPDDYNVVAINNMAQKSVSNSNSWNGTNTYYTFTNWKDYFTSPEEIEFILVRTSDITAAFYIKGLMPIYDNGFLGIAKSDSGSYSAQTITLASDTYVEDKTDALVFDNNGMVFTHQSTGTKTAVYFVTKKGAQYMVYLQYKDGSLIASTAYPLRNREDYTELTEEEYNTLMAELEKAAEEEATEADYLAALKELGVSE